MISNLMLPVSIAFIAGLITFLGPDYLGIEDLYVFLFVTLASSFFVGMQIARKWGTLWWFWPIVFVASYPTKLAIDIALDPLSHNLWPLETAFSIPYLLVGLLGAYVGHKLGA